MLRASSIWAVWDSAAATTTGRGLTAERFVPDPFSDWWARLYRTGDRCAWLADGVLDYLGRLDDQIKIRGFRVEPGEVEAALRRYPGVDDALVVAREDRPGQRRLVAYLTTRCVVPLAGPALRDFLQGMLPEYMVPTAFVLLETWPRTSGGARP